MFSSSAKAVRLAIRVWTAARLELGWTSDSLVIHLISDLVSASDGTLGKESAPCLLAYFDHSSPAFRCAKRIQWALLEFCQHRPQLCLGAAAIIYAASDLPTESDESSWQSVSATLRQAKPTQILIAASAGEQLQALPGLQMRDFAPARGSSHWRGGMQELIWTTPANLEHAQELLKNAALSLTQKDTYVAASQPTVDFAAAANGQRLTQPTQPLADQVQPPDDSDRNLQSELLELEPSSERSGGRTLWWVLAGVAVLAILATLVFFPGSRRNSAVPASAPAVAQPAPPPDSETVNAEPSSAAAPSSQDLPPPTPKAAEASAGSSAHNTSPPARHESTKKATEYNGLTEKDIPRLIRMAQNDAGAGKYEDARSEFNTVLHLDPNNQEAKLGLRKLALSEQEAR